MGPMDVLQMAEVPFIVMVKLIKEVGGSSKPFSGEVMSGQCFMMGPVLLPNSRIARGRKRRKMTVMMEPSPSLSEACNCSTAPMSTLRKGLVLFRNGQKPPVLVGWFMMNGPLPEAMDKCWVTTRGTSEKNGCLMPVK